MSPTDLTRQRCLITGLLSAKTDADTVIGQATQQITSQGGVVVGSAIQRKGVSWSKGPGGSKKTHLPMNVQMVLGSGKVTEVMQACEQLQVDVVVFVGEISASQSARLAEAIGRRVMRCAVE
jgi:hypothetical protein